MAWVSPRVYAILSKSEEGKDIIEQLPDMTQDECSQALDEFFGKGGKGYKSNAEYSQAKFDDEAEEERYKSMGDEEITEQENREDADKEEEWKTTKMASGTIHEFGDKRIIEEENEKGDTQYRINGTNGQVFSSLEEAKNAVMSKKAETPEDVKEFAKEHYKGASANYEEDEKAVNKEKVFKPTEKTIWDDIEHPLYGIAPSEQNEDYLSDAIQEMQKYSRNWNTMSKQDKNNVSPEGKKYLEMKLNRYKKALEYIKKGGK